MLGLRVDLLADMGGYLQLLTPGIPLLGRYMYPAIYKFESHSTSTARACSPTRRRPTPTAVPGGRRRRSPSSEPSTTWPPSWASTRSSCAARTGSPTRSSRTRRSCGLEYDSGNYEAATATGAGAVRTTTGCGPSRPAGGESGDPVQLGIGVSTYTEMCGLAPRRWLGEKGYVAGGWERATVRMTPLGKAEVVDRHLAARAGSRHDVQPDRRGRAGRAVRGRRGHRQRHRCRAVGARHLRLALAGRRRHRDPPRRRGPGGEGQAARCSPARGRPRRPRVRRRHLPGEGHADGDQDHPGGRVRVVRRAHHAGRQHADPVRPTT